MALLFAIDVIGRAGTRAIERRVGSEYSSNAVIGTLGALVHGGAQRPRDLQSIVGATSSAVARVLDRLEQSGDVERINGALPDDGRATVLRVTDRGGIVEGEIIAAFASATKEIRPSLRVAIEALAGLGGASSADGAATAFGGSPGGRCMALGQMGVLVVETLTSALGHIEANGALTLGLLHQRGGSARPSAVSTQLGLPSGATSKLLDRMEHAGFVQRSYGSIAQDRRGVEISLAPAGRERLAIIASRFADCCAEMFDALSALDDLLEAS